MSCKGETVPTEDKGIKRDAKDAQLEEVHSANNWEGANLGGDERHQKFLRLMGANKKEHKGRFVIGDKDARTDRTQDSATLINKKLESQYNEGMELKLSGAARHHTGLGFKDDEPEPKTTGETTTTETAKPESGDSAKPESGDSAKPESADSAKPESADSKEKSGKETEKTDPKPEESNGGEEDKEEEEKEKKETSEKEDVKVGQMTFVKSSS